MSQLAHCGRGDEIILGDQAHIFYYEQGGSAAVGSIHPRTVPNQPNGTMALEDIDAAIRPDNIHFPVTRLIVLENTHNRCNGSPLDAPYLASVRELAARFGLKIHMDGARLFNAATALNVEASALAAHADSVSICLSKGLAAPVGSLVCGSRSFIARARRARKVVGGGMRQAGVIAAAGIVALSEMTRRLDEDHANAGKLARGLAEIEGISVAPEDVKTNIVYCEVDRAGLPAEALVKQLDTEGVKVLPVGKDRFRAVTHYHIQSEDIDFTLDCFRKVLSQ